MAASDCFVSVVAPLCNDEPILSSFVDDTMGVLKAHYANFELVLIDDASTDGTRALIGDLLKRHDGLRAVRLSRSFGQEIAITAGLDSVIGDYTVVMLPDSDPPARIPDLIETCRSGVDVVYGVRVHRGQEPIWLRLGAKCFYWWCNRVLKLEVKPNATHFRGLSRQAVNALIQIKDRARYIRMLSVYVGYEAQSFEYELTHRRKRPRHKSLGQAADLAVNVIMANSFRPLRVVGVMALMMAGLNAVYLLYIAGIYLFKEQVAPGWTTLSFQMGFMFFFVFVILAVLCEYVGRILSEGQDRPLYYVQDEQVSSTPLLDVRRRNIVTDSIDEQ